MTKTYQIKQRNTNSIALSAGKRLVEFKDERNNGVLVFKTNDKSIMQGIESTKLFQNGKIEIAFVEDEKKKSKP